MDDQILLVMTTTKLAAAGNGVHINYLYGIDFSLDLESSVNENRY